MKLTIKQIIDMIDKKELQFNQSTQRPFLYANIESQLGGNAGKSTKSGALINAILYNGIQLPSVYFWHNTDTGTTNIHDGKQRILSLYYFITGNNNYKISAPDNNGKAQIFKSLTKEEQQYLLDYTLDVVEHTGTSSEEEKSFYVINTSGIPLTSYEAISGMNYGNYLNGLENYIEEQSKILNNIKPVGRGEQLLKLLIILMDSSLKNHSSQKKDIILLVCEKLRRLRNTTFNPEYLNFDKLLLLVNKLINLGIKEDTAINISQYLLIEKNWINELDKISNLYERILTGQNDIKSWNFNIHQTFINKYLLENIQLDGTRFFTKDTKDTLYQQHSHCAKCSEIKYSNLEVDHIFPWSNGGRTSINNAQLLCKHCNCSKHNL